MNPEQIAALTAIAAIVSKVGTWPIGSVIFAIVFGPWIMLFVVSRSIEKRHRAAVVMYENNVKMVERYAEMAGQLMDMVRLSTAAITELTSFLKNRTPCFERIQERRRG